MSIEHARHTREIKRMVESEGLSVLSLDMTAGNHIRLRLRTADGAEFPSVSPRNLGDPRTLDNYRADLRRQVAAARARLLGAKPPVKPRRRVPEVTLSAPYWWRGKSEPGEPIIVIVPGSSRVQTKPAVPAAPVLDLPPPAVEPAPPAHAVPAVSALEAIEALAELAEIAAQQRSLASRLEEVAIRIGQATPANELLARIRALVTS